MGNKIKINLTDDRPVVIDTDKWELLAEVVDYNGQFESQATRVWKIKIRQHNDKVVVYGWSKSQWQGERDIYAGEITDLAGVIGAIRSVADEIGNERIGRTAIRELPAQEI
jgi:hypothetical protein